MHGVSTETDPPLDPDVANWLIRVLPDRDPETVAEAREHSRTTNAQALAQMSPEPVPASEVDGEIPADGDAPAIAIRVLRPARVGEPGGRVVDDAPLPTVVYFHGGGWVVGDLDTHLGHARRICTQARAVVVSVAYRLAPEHRFPAAFDDAVRATEWVASASTSSAAPTRWSSPATAPAASSRRRWPSPAATPASRWPRSCCSTRSPTSPAATPTTRSTPATCRAGSSHKRFGLTLEGMVNFAHTYVGERTPTTGASRRSGPPTSPASPRRSSTPRRWTCCAPRATSTATTCAAAGVEVISREHPSLNHSYFGLGGVSAVADAAAAQAASDLHDLLDRRATEASAPVR